MDYVLANPGQEDLFPQAGGRVADSAAPYRVIGYLGFGKLGPLRWNNTFFSYKRLAPDQSYVETHAQGRDYTIYVADLTRDRYQLVIGNEMQIRIIPDRLDAVWGVLYGNNTDYSNTIQASQTNSIYYSTVLRLQLYLTRTVHLLFEGSLAQEKSKNGNASSAITTTSMLSEHGRHQLRHPAASSTATDPLRNTMPIKGGIVFNPTGLGNMYAWRRSTR